MRLDYVEIPIGSTQKVGSSVKGGREPAEYDSSPMLRKVKQLLRVETEKI